MANTKKDKKTMSFSNLLITLSSFILLFHLFLP